MAGGTEIGSARVSVPPVNGDVSEHGGHMPRTVRRSPDTIQLRVTSPPSASERTAQLATVPLLPWPLAAGVGGAGAALLGWLLVVGVVGVGWFTASAIPLPDVLAFCSGIWLLAHGGSAEIGGLPVTLAPLGLTLVGAGLAAAIGRFAAGQARLARPGAQRLTDRLALALQVCGLLGAGYAAVTAAMAATLDLENLVAPTLGALAVAVVAGFIGALRGLEVKLVELLPSWLRAIAYGGAAGGLTLLALGAVLVGLAMLAGAEQVAVIETGLGLDPAGQFIWAVIALAYLPTVATWALSWALGGGFVVGTGSLVTVSGTKLGMLPAIPLLGGLPPVGVAPETTVAWLASGAVIGLLAGAVAAGRIRRASSSAVAAGQAVAVGLGAGLLTVAALLGMAALGTGALGALRLAELGPRLPELALIAGPMIAGSALLGGLLRWLVGMVRNRRPASVG